MNTLRTSASGRRKRKAWKNHRALALTQKSNDYPPRKSWNIQAGWRSKGELHLRGLKAWKRKRLRLRLRKRKSQDYLPRKAWKNHCVFKDLALTQKRKSNDYPPRFFLESSASLLWCWL